jgi:hypothetical protein
MHVGTQITLLTALFAGTYAAMRTIPATNCNFMHYEETVVTADGLQFCGTGTAFFVDLDKLPFPVKVNLSADHAPATGVESHYTLSLETSDGQILRPSQLAVSQTSRLHLLLVDSNLEDYQHIHPVPVGDSGQWTFPFTPHGAGQYHAYAQFIPSLSMREMIGQTQIQVPGDLGPAVHRGLAPFKDDGYVYTLTTSASPVAADSSITLTLTVQRADGGKVELQEIMGTLAHLVAFDPSRDGVAHLHPTLTGKERDPTHPQLAFLINFIQPGQYRVWGQVKINNRERYIPFDVDVTS